MWDYRYLSRIDYRTVPILLALMWISILVISSMTGNGETETFLTKPVKIQIQWFMIGWLVYFFFVGMDYRKLRSWSWVLYGVILLLLIGLFFTSAIQNVHRWYRVPFLGREFQPSEYAKLIVVITLSCFLETKGRQVSSWATAFQALAIVFVPFFLILKQPDLGTALVLYPIALVMFYFGGINKKVVAAMTVFGAAVLLFVGLMFTGVISHEGLRPYATKFLKEYQYERLTYTYHQKAAQTAIGLGGVTGLGWHKSEFSGREWLPAAYTDSVFAAYAEEFGLTGVFLMLLFFFGLIYFSFQVTAGAKDMFGRLLSAGITVYLAVHIIFSIGMMCGFLPISGVPLILVTFGGSSVVSTMMALGILQSIYSRRFMF
ncbi:MAG TPA: FtsW/RodA/SpoVE family cell cycle protein [Rhabdochlamydiaceae bacterium]|nr:FtsW/RodA/SpoVE family cell cycle protein [Rhabdochlamydiaceae bacterium]